MDGLPQWNRFVVPQRNPLTGCIPAGYEMLLRAAGVDGVNYSSFQEDFDLGAEHNNFKSVADAVTRCYPHVRFVDRSFDTGAEKVRFIEGCLNEQRPVLVSLSNGPGQGWHIMLVVQVDNDSFALLVAAQADGNHQLCRIQKQRVAWIHDNCSGGKDVAFLERAKGGSQEK